MIKKIVFFIFTFVSINCYSNTLRDSNDVSFKDIEKELREIGITCTRENSSSGNPNATPAHLQKIARKNKHGFFLKCSANGKYIEVYECRENNDLLGSIVDITITTTIPNCDFINKINERDNVKVIESNSKNFTMFIPSDLDDGIKKQLEIILQGH